MRQLQQLLHMQKYLLKSPEPVFLPQQKMSYSSAGQTIVHCEMQLPVWGCSVLWVRQPYAGKTYG